MLDKELLKIRFKKSLSTYSANACIQLEIAKKLADFAGNNYDDILEIGSYSGFLTREIAKKVNFNTYTALDIIDSYDCIKDISHKIKFQVADIEETNIEGKYDLIISSSSLQWCENLAEVIKKLKGCLKPSGHIMIAIFGKQNLYQIKDVFNVSLHYPDISEIRKIFSSKAKIIEETKTLQFENPREVLRHLKYTGVNSLKVINSYSQIKEKLKIIETKYQNKLTYNPLYIID